MAKVAITKSETNAACHASRRRSRSLLSETSARKIGVAPGGSKITSRVTKDCTAKVSALTVFIEKQPFVDQP